MPSQSAYPRRPPRLARVFPAYRPLYFITFNTFPRRPILDSPDVHEAFLAYAWNARERGIAVGTYVLMPDHAHLVVLFSRDNPKPDPWVKGLRTVMGKTLVSLGEDKPHWQEGFVDHLIRSREDLEETVAYIRANPVVRGLVENPGDWPYAGELCRVSFDQGWVDPAYWGRWEA
jgi:putative transposase